jgi:hypothetical protein
MSSIALNQATWFFSTARLSKTSAGMYADQPLSRSVDGELTQVAADPFAVEFFRHGQRGAGAAEDISDEVAFVGGGLDDAFEQGFWLLGGVAKKFCVTFSNIPNSLLSYVTNVSPNVIRKDPFRFVKVVF